MSQKNTIDNRMRWNPQKVNRSRQEILERYMEPDQEVENRDESNYDVIQCLLY